ncbi:glucose-1-phosphate adenylyltransferase subunit GlgD [Vermiculatibacterium agrestimuris]|uniref:glucose-1-phosphate adenylyltransferase subunit GlgD n=1 Tax=Vermiculatibacterium agrestimuris TaxID=2941519 RepID=UPI00203C3879|nr:glucose-1-phosphate adenylyltransferase subunit GlgD [Vermiculatibacterium agrestimuris]
MNDLHGIIFAYRENPDLRELVQLRNTCSIPFGGRYRLVDFALSNMVNAGIDDVGLIVYTSYQSLLDHVGSGKDWDLARKRGGLRILPPFSFSGKHGGRYRGRMDALAGVYSYLKTIRQDYVVLASGDLAANLPIAEAFEQHIKSGADITAICSGTTYTDPKLCNYFSVDGQGRITDVAASPTQVKGDVASLEVYILSKSLLMSLVDQCAAHDVPSFSQGVLLASLGKLDMRVFRFDGYIARVTSVAGYFQQNMALLDPGIRANLFRTDRPVKTKDQSNPSTYYGPESKSVNSLISDGCRIEGTVINSILARGVRVEKGATVENCILMQRSSIQEGAVLRYAIADKNVRVCPGRMLMGHGTYPLVIAKNEIV